MRHFGVSLAGIALALAAVGAQAAPPRYTVESMPIEPDWDSYANTIAGEFVAGNATSSDGHHEVAVISDHRKYRHRQVFNGRFTVVNGVNASGTLVGRGQSKATQGNHAFIAPIGEPARWLIPVGFDSDSVAEAVNDAGTVVGWYRENVQYSPMTAFIWKEGALKVIPPLQAGSNNWPHAINAAGTVVGHSVDSDLRPQAFTYNGDVLTQLQSLSKFGADAYGINVQGWVVGRAYVDDLDSRPVLWRDGQLIDLGMLPAATSATAFAVNAGGVVVGAYELDNNSPRGWVWSDGQLADLNDLVDGLPAHAVVLDARAVDDQGRIAATLGRWSHADHRWRTVGAVLKPVEAAH